MKLTVAAAAIAGASLFASAPAQADSFGFRFGPHGGIGFSYDTGGYCDSWGCPDDFWDYPIAYCPVFFRGEWYRGPFYYIYRHGRYYYWIHGGWRSDDWGFRRPYGACVDRFGPALDFDFYLSHGFRWRDDWRYRWYRGHGGRNWDRDRHRDWHTWDMDRRGDRHDRNRGDWNRGGSDGRVWDHSGDRNVAPQGGTGGGSGGGDWDRRGRDGRVWDHGGDRTIAPQGGTGGGGDTGGGDGGRHHHERDWGGGGTVAPSGGAAVAPSGGWPWGGGDGGRRHHDSNASGGGTVAPYVAPAAAPVTGLPGGGAPPVATGGLGASGSGGGGASTGDGGHHHDGGSSDAGDSGRGDNGHHGHHETP
jgi:hypothetical protein